MAIHIQVMRLDEYEFDADEPIFKGIGADNSDGI